MARTLIQGLLGRLSDEQQAMLQRIETRAGTLAGSVGDLLQLAGGRAQLSTAELEEIRFCALLEDNLRTFAPVAEEKGVHLEIHCPAGTEPRVYGRREGLQSIVANLLSNAIKYTPAGGTVTVSAAESGEDLLFEVRDTGIGIPLDEQGRLFDEFFRGSNARRLAETGTGLGLAIVKATVEQHGGRIEVDSREGQGTAFRVYLRRVGKK
jgi:signal transduction histidine kinase